MPRIVNYYNSISSPDEYVGARVYESHIDFYFPHGYIVDVNNELDCRNKALNILYLISIAAQSEQSNSFSTNSNLRTGNYPFLSYIWLIKDYYDNGLSFSLKKNYEMDGSGRINWLRTFKKKPLPTQDGFIYLNLIAEQKTKTSNLLSIIHNYCLNIAFSEIGWLFEDKKFKKVDALSNSQILFYEQYLLKEQNVTFNDHKKTLINHLLRILRFSIGKKDYYGRFEIGTYSFYHVWEKMIQKVYANKPLDEFFPNAIWHIGETTKNGSKLRPDAVMEYDRINKKTLYILDAKYYKFGLFRDNPDYLPGSSDVQKQKSCIFYE